MDISGINQLVRLQNLRQKLFYYKTLEHTARKKWEDLKISSRLPIVPGFLAGMWGLIAENMDAFADDQKKRLLQIMDSIDDIQAEIEEIEGAIPEPEDDEPVDETPKDETPAEDDPEPEIIKPDATTEDDPEEDPPAEADPEEEAPDEDDDTGGTEINVTVSEG